MSLTEKSQKPNRIAKRHISVRCAISLICNLLNCTSKETVLAQFGEEYRLHHRLSRCIMHAARRTLPILQR